MQVWSNRVQCHMLSEKQVLSIMAKRQFKIWQIILDMISSSTMIIVSSCHWNLQDNINIKISKWFYMKIILTFRLFPGISMPMFELEFVLPYLIMGSSTKTKECTRRYQDNLSTLMFSSICTMPCRNQLAIWYFQWGRDLLYNKRLHGYYLGDDVEWAISSAHQI